MALNLRSQAIRFAIWRAAKRHTDGVTLDELAAAANCSRSTAATVVQELGIEHRRVGGKHSSRDEQTEAMLHVAVDQFMDSRDPQYRRTMFGSRAWRSSWL